MRKGQARIGWGVAVAAAMAIGGVVQAAEVAVPRGAYALQADVQGEGATTVVFESGFGQGAGVWKGVVAGLGADCRCIAYARAGLGRSGSDGRARTIDEHVADLAALIEALAPGKVVLVGHSYGGVVISEAGNHDKVRSLVYVAAFAPGPNQSVNAILSAFPQPEWFSSLHADAQGWVTWPAEPMAR